MKHLFHTLSHVPALVRFAVIVMALTLAAHTHPAQCDDVPDTPEGRRVMEYIDILNSGNSDIIRKYVTDNFDETVLKRFPMHMVTSMLMGFYYESAGLGYEFHSMHDSDSNKLAALVYNKLTGSWANLHIPIAENPPYKINGRPEIKPASPPADVRTVRLSDNEIINRLELCMGLLIDDDQFSGTVLVAKNGKPLFKEAYGMASKSYSVPNRIDTKFNIASAGKMFTGVAVAQLAEQGKLSFDDPVGKYLSSDWITSEAGEKIQIRHLLTHTAGYGTYFRKLYMQTKQPFFRGVDDYKTIIADEIPAFEPGTKWSYSNTGMHLLGVIIEKVTGESYYDYIRDHIYRPAGMAGTDAYDKDIPLANRATAYTKEGGQWRTSLFTRVLKGGPSGGGYSTVEDFLKFDIAIREHKLLSPEYTELVLSAKPEINATFYGYGFFVSKGDAGRIAEHGGDGTGISTSFKMYLDSGYTVVVLSNYSRPAANIVSNVINQMIGSQ